MGHERPVPLRLLYLISEQIFGRLLDSRRAARVQGEPVTFGHRLGASTIPAQTDLEHPQFGVAGFPVAARACLRRATRYFTASMVRNAVTTAIRIGAVCKAPTWVRNAASSTIENGAAASDPGRRRAGR